METIPATAPETAQGAERASKPKAKPGLTTEHESDSPALAAHPAQPDPSQLTGVMKQFWDLKAQAPDALLFFRMGDFYELFADDAVEAARILEITLTSRDRNKPNPMPMAGVPFHSVQGYLQKLLDHGKKVAICEQFEDPTNKKLVKREIVRILTPGIQFEGEGAEARYLAAVCAHPGGFGMALVDVSTGETRIGALKGQEDLLGELAALPVRHVVYLRSASIPTSLVDSVRATLASRASESEHASLVEELPENYLSREQAQALLKRHYQVELLDAIVGAEQAQALDPIRALGIAIQYLLKTQKQESLPHLRQPTSLKRSRALAMSPRAAEHLDLPELFQLINRAGSALGARQLKRWLASPLASPDEIRERQDSVRALSDELGSLSRQLAKSFKETYDLERILGRVTTGLASPRDTLALGQSLARLGEIAASLEKSSSSKPLPTLLSSLSSSLTDSAIKLRALGERITGTQREDAPFHAREGKIFREGTTPELDRLIKLTTEGEKWLVELETKEREQTGIPSLKVKYNRVFGYFIEVTQANLKSVPAHYQRKQTTVGAERFFTEELKKFEEEILTAGERQKALEAELFRALVSDIQAVTRELMELARASGELDALLSLADLKAQPGWVFPEIDASTDLEIERGRHPLVDASLRGALVPNSVLLGEKLTPSRLGLIITGPNMGGKSTLMRMAALIVILGQMGAPVPADRARWGAVSSLYTRIGAHDAIARGQSTFMVEMVELAHLLHRADERSLIVLDEIGRGTSTYDGISVAWATLEWISSRIRARTLFATHYHELTELVGKLPGLANTHMAVESPQSGGSSKLRFLYELREGPANESFGIHVASMAGIPKPIISRAWEVLEELEHHSSSRNPEQLGLFAAPPVARARAFEAEPAKPEPSPIVKELLELDVNDLTPLQALNALARLQENARKPE